MKQYSQILYVSPNLNENGASFLAETKFVNEMKELAQPVPIDFMSSIPSLDQIHSFLSDDSSKLLLMLDDFNFSLFQSEAISEIYCRMSSHFGVDILSTTHR